MECILVIIVRCQNGVVLFTVSRLKEIDSLKWFCLNDKSVGQQPRTSQGLEQLLKDMATKATNLRGSLLQIVDLPEIS